MARGVQFMKNIPATVRVVTELEDKGCQQATDVAFEGILKIKVKVRNQRQFGLSHDLDVLNNSGAYPKYEFSIQK
jgi:hypothetical protein